MKHTCLALIDELMNPMIGRNELRVVLWLQLQSLSTKRVGAQEVIRPGEI